MIIKDRIEIYNDFTDNLLSCIDSQNKVLKDSNDFIKII